MGIVMDLQVKRSANRGTAILLFVGAFFLLVLGLVVGGLVYAQTSFWTAALVFGVLFVLSMVLVALAAVLLMWRILFPQTLRVCEGKIQWLHGNEVVGQIPVANVVAMKVLRESPQNMGGGLAAAFAQKRIEEGKGLAFRIEDADDKDTFWPAGSRPQRFELQMDTPWEMTYQALHDALLPLVPSKSRGTAVPASDPRPSPTVPAKAVAEKNPFDFS
ncbi:MAG TPA: hypothetical protein VFE62_07635 [Gemmataceae bacterium]|nr:hypothetical protein [Gemmataceae bacterium]